MHIFNSDYRNDFLNSPRKKKNFLFSYENQAIRFFKEQLKDYNIQTEVSTGLYSIDIFLPHQKLVIEIDGSSHYYGLTESELMRSSFKYRLYEKAGFDVMRLPY
jgi:very-short-patch-repair endonuclease